MLFCIYNIGIMRNPFEPTAEYVSSKEKLENLRQKAVELAANMEINEMDRVRLTRVLQLVDRYGPELNKEFSKEEAAEAKSWLDTLKTWLRFNRVNPDDQKQKKPVDQGRAYLIAEETVATLRELRHLASKLKEGVLNTSIETLMTQERPEKIIARESFDTSLTLQYEEQHWGTERVCLDGMQNHLPSDSKGEQVGLGFSVDGKWVSLAQAAKQKDKIQAVRFVDDGVGFDMQNLALLYSTKADEEESRGQFGEGMKMIAAASLRLGLDMEYESQNWSAKPVKKLVTLNDTRHGENKPIEQLSFEAVRYEGKPMFGSRTTVWHPTPEFLNEALKLEEKVLDLRPEYKPLYTSEIGEIVSREAGKMYAKGIFIYQEPKALFSYNFNDVKTNRDRNQITSHDITENVARIWSDVSDIRLIKTLLKKVQDKNSNDILEDIYFKLKYPSVWQQAFTEAFGPDAVLDTGYAIPKGVTLPKKVKLIAMPGYLKSALIEAGIPSEKSTVPDKYQERLPTSLTLKYGEQGWDERRIFLDAVQNHLPSDSGGSAFYLRFQTKDGQWHAYNELKDVQDDQIKTIKISDNGRGYDYQNLQFLNSSKEDSDASGKFGEGMKMVAAAALRADIAVEYGSRKWRAVPAIVKHTVDGREINQLVFDVTHYVNEEPPIDDKHYGQSQEVSTTTFSNLTPELIQQFRDATKNVIGVDSKRPEASTSAGDIMHLNGGMLYVRRLLIPGDHRLMNSYHLPHFDIKSRDRSHIDQDDLEHEIAKILSEVKEAHIIRTLLLQIKLSMESGGSNPVESTIEYAPHNKELWKQAFHEAFGENASVMNVTRSGEVSMGQANHVGLKVITMPPRTAATLEAVGVPTYESELKEIVDNMQEVSMEDLTEEELEMIDRLSYIDQFMPYNREADLFIFKTKDENEKSALGLCKQKGKEEKEEIWIRRDQLEAFERAAFVYMHEKTHQNTGGAPDSSSEFRDYLTLVAARLSIDQLSGIKVSSAEGSRHLGLKKAKPKMGMIRLP